MCTWASMWLLICNPLTLVRPVLRLFGVGIKVSPVIECWTLFQRCRGPRTLMRHNATAPAVICLILFPAVFYQALCKRIRPVIQLHRMCDVRSACSVVARTAVYKATKTCLHAVEIFACH